MRTNRLILIILMLCYMAGLWHGFPLTGVVVDEPFPGAVLKAAESHSLFPQGYDVPYGTVTYYAVYFVIGIFSALALPFFALSLTAYKMFLFGHLYVPYLLGRLTSLAAVILLILLAFRLAGKDRNDHKWRFFLVTTLFTSLVVVAIFHSVKVWPVSVLFLFTSFYFTYAALEESVETHKRKRSIFYSIIFSFLAFANFPLFGFSLVSIPIFVYWHRRDKRLLKTVLLAATLGLFLFIVIIASNVSGILGQVGSIVTDYTLSENAMKTNVSIPFSAFLYALKTVMLYPFFVLSLIILWLSRNKAADKKLFLLGSVYFLVYFLSLYVVARWSTDVYSYYRYLVPIGFFLFAILLSFKVEKLKLYHYFFAGISLVYFLFALYYLSIPTTMNLAAKWIRDNVNREGVLVERFGLSDLELPMNEKTANAIRPELCGAMCKAYISHELSSTWKGVVITEQTDSKKGYELISAAKESYFISGEKVTSDLFIPVAAFESGSSNVKYPPLLEHLGNYFDSEFFFYGRLGRNIYVYKI